MKKILFLIFIFISTNSSYAKERFIPIELWLGISSTGSNELQFYEVNNKQHGGKLKVSSKQILSNYEKIKKIDPKKNCVIGFGITLKTISSLKKADGLVVGSAICKEISKSLSNRQNPVINVSRLVSKLKNKIL